MLGRLAEECVGGGGGGGWREGGGGWREGGGRVEGDQLESSRLGPPPLEPGLLDQRDHPSKRMVRLRQLALLAELEQVAGDEERDEEPRGARVEHHAPRLRALRADHAASHTERTARRHW